MKRIFSLIIGAVLLMPAIGWAADTGAVAAALKDDAAECRYLAKLCTDATWAKGEWAAGTARMEHALAAQNYSALQQAQVEAEAAHRLFMTELGQLGDARQVVESKHEQMPACYQRCSLE